MNALALDGFVSFLAGLSGVVQNQRHAGTDPGLAVQRRGVEAQKTRARISHLKLVADDARPAVGGRGGDAFPVQFGQELGDGPAFRLLGPPAQELGDGVVEIDDAPVLIEHQDAILDGVEQGLQEIALAREPLHHGLQTFGVEPPDAAQHFIQKARFGSHDNRGPIWHNRQRGGNEKVKKK